MNQGPKELVAAWVEAFNRADADALAGFYAEDAVNHQVAEAPVAGREAIREMFRREFAAAGSSTSSAAGSSPSAGTGTSSVS